MMYLHFFQRFLGDYKMEFSFINLFFIVLCLCLLVAFFHSDVRITTLCAFFYCVAGSVFKFDPTKLLFCVLLVSKLCYSEAFGLAESPNIFCVGCFFPLLSSISVALQNHLGDFAFLASVKLSDALTVILLTCVPVFAAKTAYFGAPQFGFVLWSHLSFTGLIPHLGSEAYVISSFLGYYAADSVASAFDFSIDRVLSLEDFEWMLGRDIILCAFCFTFLMNFLIKWMRIAISEDQWKSASSLILWLLCWISLSWSIGALFLWYQSYYSENFILRELEIILNSSLRQLSLLSWIVVIPIAVIFIYTRCNFLPRLVRRKLFHFVGVLVFVAPASFTPSFLFLSTSIACALFILIEVGRYHHVRGFQCFSCFLCNHLDKRESERGVVRSHIYLIHGFSASIFFSCHLPPYSTHRSMRETINLIPGIVSLGIIDSFAAIIGRSIGKGNEIGLFLNCPIFPPKLNRAIQHKTIFGTLGGILCAFFFWFEVVSRFLDPNFTEADHWLITGLLFMSGFTECFVEGIDNLHLPPLVLISAYFFYAIREMVSHQ